MIDRSHILTCAHVVNASLGRTPRLDAEDIIHLDFRVPRGWYPAQAVLADGGWHPLDGHRGDVAVLRVTSKTPPSATPAVLSPLTLRDAVPFDTEGFPEKHNDGIGAHGSILRLFIGVEWVQLEADGYRGRRLTKGFSGAPIFDRERQVVVGMVTAEDSKEPAAGISAMIPVEVLVTYWPPLAELLPTCKMINPNFWDTVARGVEHPSRPGWFFTGRTEAIRDLTEWLTAPLNPANNVAIVTAMTEKSGGGKGGGPGSGKSAVLGRLVTMSDRRYRSKMREQGVLISADDPINGLPIGSIHVAIRARAREARQVFSEVAAALSLSIESPSTSGSEDPSSDDVHHIVAALLSTSAPFTVVVDGLDEASSPGVLAELLAEFAEAGADAGLRVLIGTRPGHDQTWLKPFGPNVLLIDLNATKYSSMDELAMYVERRLLEGNPASSTLSHGKNELTGDVAREVARKAYPSFLFAQLVCRSLLNNAEPVSPQLVKKQGFPHNVSTAIAAYLRSVGGDRKWVEDLLRPLAYAHGQGLPSGEIWAALATALSKPRQQYTGEDVDALLSVATDYLIEIPFQGHDCYYRLHHQAFVDYLRHSTAFSHELALDIVFEILLAQVPVRDGRLAWNSVSPYIAVNLAKHASDAGRLVGLLASADGPAFVIAAEPNNLLSALAAPQVRVSRIAIAYRLAYDKMWAQPPSTRAAYLELAARLLGDGQLATAFEDDRGQDWRVSWLVGLRARWRYTLAAHSGTVHAVAIAAVNGQRMIISGGADGLVHLWDLASGAAISVAPYRHQAGVRDIAITKVESAVTAVTVGDDGAIWLWNLEDLDRTEQIAAVLGEGLLTVSSTTNRKPPAVFTGSDRGTIRIWNLQDRSMFSTIAEAHEGQVRAIALVERDGELVVFSGGTDGALFRWNFVEQELADRALINDDDLPGVNMITALSARTLASGREVLIVGGADRSVHLFDVRTGSPLRVMSAHLHWISAVDIAVSEESEESTVAVTGDDEGAVWLWDLLGGEPIGDPLAAHTGTVSALASEFDRENNLTLVTAGEDGKIRVWELLGSELRRSSTDDAAYGVRAIATTVVENDEFALTGGVDGSLWLWDVDSGFSRSHTRPGHLGRICCVAATHLNDRPVAISGADDGTLRLWDLASRSPIGAPVPTSTGQVYAVAVAWPSDRPVAISGGQDGTLRLWDLADRSPIGGPLRGHNDAVWAVATVQVDKMCVAVTGSDDGTLRAWDVTSRRQLGDPFGQTDSKIWALDVAIVDNQLVVLTAGDDGSVRYWDFASRKPLQSLLSVHTGAIWAVATAQSSAGPVALTGGDDGKLRLWDVRLRSEIAVVDVGFPICAIARTSDGAFVVACSTGLLHVRFPAYSVHSRHVMQSI